MAQAQDEHPGAMAAVIGLAAEDLQRLCDEIDGSVAPANFNTPAQIVVSGSDDAVDELVRRVDELEDAATRDRQAIAELSAALGDRPPPEDAEAAAEEDAPASVLEAVRVAAETCRNLVFTESAFDSAADSPYRRPEEILDALRTLDALGERYNAGQMGVSLGQAAQEAGLSWRAGVSELARTRWAKHYVVTHDGHNLDLGPHLALGSGSGAGFVARVYLHLADGNGGVPRGIYVGHVGRHLPDTTT
jgi:hypothetical protein